MWLFLAAALSINVLPGCTAKRSGSIAKNSPVPNNVSNTDSSGTSPSVKLTPAPFPNTRPNPVPNPPPPNPER